MHAALYKCCTFTVFNQFIVFDRIFSCEPPPNFCGSVTGKNKVSSRNHKGENCPEGEGRHGTGEGGSVTLDLSVTKSNAATNYNTSTNGFLHDNGQRSNKLKFQLGSKKRRH